ncbi:hypothetical protein EYF80_037156 [Liparis tanakae]|uniref:Uncharacterized protein n=1 Tax=Liparis tanakae TaxID=230148 RepID=A0A4Z2GGP3_9TELE|nr:hypothetical protein EYF80_037156 [Liparis tanakae]
MASLNRPTTSSPSQSVALKPLQLFNRQAEFGQRLGDFPRLFGESVGHGRHHGRAFGTAALRQEESNIGVWDQTADRLPQQDAGQRGRDQVGRAERHDGTNLKERKSSSSNQTE